MWFWLFHQKTPNPALYGNVSESRIPLLKKLSIPIGMLNFLRSGNRLSETLLYKAEICGFGHFTKNHKIIQSHEIASKSQTPIKFHKIAQIHKFHKIPPESRDPSKCSKNESHEI